MPSIAVLGNCQAPPIAHILARIVPGASVTAFPLSAINTDTERERTARTLHDFDLVFVQPLSQPKHGPLQVAELQARKLAVILFPEIIFKGFHPDFIGGSRVKGVRSAAMEYHSCLVAAAFANGIPAERVPPLFNAFNFARLGYFQEYAAGRDFLLSRAAALGYDLAKAFCEWEQEGVFMHTPNHPKVPVLTTIAAKAAQKAELPIDVEMAHGVQDRFSRKVLLPVYPAIAKRLRVLAGPEFAVGQHKARRIFDLKDYVAETYALYSSAPKGFFEERAIQRAAAILN